MNSVLVVTSWWSNALALMCLSRLTAFAPQRAIFLMQAGKTDEQKRRLRAWLPRQVTELYYPQELADDDSTMREYLATEALSEQEGVWFVDHDTFFHSPLEDWLREADDYFARSQCCLCTRSPSYPGEGVTQPAFWLSPQRWPKGISSFHPIPYRDRSFAHRPDLYRHAEALVIPGKDTLVQAREEIDALGQLSELSLQSNQPTGQKSAPPFPPHEHIGGLHFYLLPARPPGDMPAPFHAWRRHVVACFERFFRACRAEWLAIEEPELLRRHCEVFYHLHGVASAVSTTDGT